MFADGDERGVCHLKTDTLERPLLQAVTDSRGQLPTSAFLANERLFDGLAIRHTSAAVSVERIDPLISEQWDQAVALHPDATIFHTSAWGRVLSETYGHKPVYLRVCEGDKPVALVPMMEVRSSLLGCRGVCLPFSDSVSPLFFGDEKTKASVISSLSQIARERNWRYFELRFTPSPNSALEPHDTFYTHQLDLRQSPNELFEGFASSVRRAIRKAERSELSAEVSSDLAVVREFYRLHGQTRRRHGVPPQPFSFFRNIHRHIVSRGLGFVVTARLDGRAVAAAVFFHFGRNALFKFGASDDRHQELRPNNLVMWEGIKHAAELGMERLHLGRTDFDQEGLRRFKLSLGTEEELLHYYRFDPSSSRSIPRESRKTSSLAHAICRRLPLTINKLAGTILYPHLH